MLNKRTYLIFSCFIILIVSGCHREERFKDLKQQIAQIKQSKEKRYMEKSISTLELPPPMTYQMASQRAPFQIMNQTPPKIRPSLNPLQTYSITMLRFIGTMTSGNRVFAYVLAPNNMVYKVKEGDPIGIQGGKVVRVLPRLIDILELDVENGKPSKRIITLQLKEER